jgi:hypothetical protein
MDHDEQRNFGIKLTKAGGVNWQKTQAAIESKNSCYESILHTAVGEAGVDAVVSQVLQGPPEWAYNTLRYVPNLGQHRDALLKKTSEDREWALHALRLVPDLGNRRDFLAKTAGELAQSNGNISGMSLLDQGGYDCKWTLFWANAGNIQPKKSYPDNGSWKWSSVLLLGQNSGRIDLSTFALPNAPLQAGNEVWMYMYVYGGYDIESPIHFIYDPNTAATANFTSSGTTTSDNLGFNGITSVGERAA